MNIFIAKTPYHVLLAHSVALHLKKNKVKNFYLIYSGNDFENIDSIVTKSLWKNILHFNITLHSFNPYYRSIIKKWVKRNGLWNKKPFIYISDDMNWKSQILENYLYGKKRFLIEDGIGSYYRSELTSIQKIFRYTILRVILLGLKLQHYGGVSQSLANGYYSINDNAYPWRQERHKVFNIFQHLEFYLKSIANRKRSDISEHIDLVVLTQPFYESGILSKQDDIDHHKKLIQPFTQKEINILVKKHPRESENIFIERVKALEGCSTNITIYPLSDDIPAEALLIYTNTQTIIVSSVSTALINLKKLNPLLQVFYNPLDDNHPTTLLFEKSGIIKL